MAIVLISDPIHPVCEQMLSNAGISTRTALKASPEELAELAADVDGWIIRSGTQVTAELISAAKKLRVVGRAGVGVDNVDLEAATHGGVLVINAPSGNTVSTAEHTIAMMLSMARRIPQANSSLREGAWDRKSFMGFEVFEKTLGIVGVGKIGRTVAERMQAFGMTVIGYDPVLSPDLAARAGIELVDLDELFERSDFITVHTPLNDATRSLLNRETLAKCKQGVGIVNCARGGIIDEKALLESLEAGHVGGAALDVYSSEPPPEWLEALLAHPRVVATPHIAASTEEAQEKVARQVTEQVINALQDSPVSTAVNALAIRMAGHREVQPFLALAARLGSIVRQRLDAPVADVVVRCHGDVPRRYADVLLVSALTGLMQGVVSGQVNLVNATVLAEEAGLHANVQTFHSDSSYTNLVEVVARSGDHEDRVTGSIFGNDDPRLVCVGDYWVEVKPEGSLLFYRNVDRPGMLARVGSLLAEGGVNIACLALGRHEPGTLALTVISLDETVPEKTLTAVRSIEGVQDVRHVSV
jgi:D-3-phosphoglycerate dehydrogenase